MGRMRCVTMTRQDGGTHGIPPYHAPSHHSRPIASVGRALALVAALFLLPGCSGPFGTAMTGLFGAGAMFAGQATLDRGKEDKDAKIAWRAKKREYVTAFASGLGFEAETHKRAGRFAEWKTVMADLLKFWDKQRPETLILELKRRARETENATGAQETSAVRAAGG